jgi:outer membrane protein assembly factor BamB
MNHACSALTLIGCLAATTSLDAQTHWPQFRGADSRGIGTSDQLPLEWSREKNVAWQVAVPGRGWSSPITWGDRVFLTTAVSEGQEEEPRKGLYFGGERGASTNRHRWLMLCLERDTGRTLWTTELAARPPAASIHVKNSHASETPVTDGERVYALFGQLGVYCLDFNGQLLWSKPLDPRETRYGWGTSSSPVLHGDRLFVVRDFEERSELLAFNKYTGEEVWKVEREEPTNFATPFVWRNADRTELVVPGRNRVRSYDLDGRLLWWLKGLSTITIPTPFEVDGLLYLAAGYVGDRENPNKPVYAVRPGGAGDLTLPEGERSSRFIAWMEPNAAPYNPSPLAFDGGLYVLWDFGFLSNRNVKSGMETYDKQRLKTDGTAAFTASPWAYRGRVFCLSEDGDTYVVKAGNQYELERVNSLDELCLATPAIAGDRLFIRTATGLWCLRAED